MSPIFTVLYVSLVERSYQNFLILGALRLLMFASGLPTAEKPTAKKFYLMSHGPNVDEGHAEAWRNYKAYLNRTSILIPIPPYLYQHIPSFLKRTILLDFPIYSFDEKKDGPAAVEEQRNRQGS